MKRKYLIFLLLIGFVLTGCGNKKLIDFTNTFEYAQIRLPDGQIIKGKVDKWRDYEGEQLQITID